jgi:hypothetical protein
VQNPRDTGSWLKYALIGIAIVILVVIGVVIGGIGIVLSQVIK